MKKSQNLLLNLTEHTVPSKKEFIIYNTIRLMCNKQLMQDERGNLYYEIGTEEERKILFTAHLDDVSKKVQKIKKYIVNEQYLTSDEKTILGGDNKTGCAILINMLNNNIPGTYYFFVEEEIGRKGSVWFAENLKKDFNLTIAFDRREIGSIVTHQRGRKLSSDSLTDQFIKEFSNSEYKFKEDLFGFSSDSYSLHERSNACINISNGTYNEHKKEEKVDLIYFDYIFNRVIDIDWQLLNKIAGEEKVRKDIDTSRLTDDHRMKSYLDFFLENGYRPNKAPKWDEPFTIYKEDLYFREKSPRIFDHFTILIEEKTGKILIDEFELEMEELFDYINDYKKALFKFKIKDTDYQIGGVEYDEKKGINYVYVIENDNFYQLTVDRKMKFVKKNVNNFTRVRRIIRKHFRENNLEYLLK